jgi:hypothetical protein
MEKGDERLDRQGKLVVEMRQDASTTLATTQERRDNSVLTMELPFTLTTEVRYRTRVMILVAVAEQNPLRIGPACKNRETDKLADPAQF